MSPHMSNMATIHVATWKISLCLAKLLKFNPFFLNLTLLGGVKRPIRIIHCSVSIPIVNLWLYFFTQHVKNKRPCCQETQFFMSCRVHLSVQYRIVISDNTVSNVGNIVNVLDGHMIPFKSSDFM
jgi:hypothetical protein